MTQLEQDGRDKHASASVDHARKKHKGDDRGSKIMEDQWMVLMTKPAGLIVTGRVPVGKPYAPQVGRQKIREEHTSGGQVKICKTSTGGLQHHHVRW